MHSVGNIPGAHLPVRSPQGDYEIVLGRGLLEQAGALAAELRLGRRVLVATDTSVAPLYGDVVLAALREAGFAPVLAAMPAGEQHKSMDSVDLFIEALLDAKLDRSGWVLALGGGVVGDTAGFAASIYMRGVPLVQAPTTLLAMADSSIGGKVGVDHPRGKNLLGAFKQPARVVADLDTLNSLPPEQVASGMAEVIKAGIIADPVLFSMLEESGPAGLDLERALLRAIAVKRDIVERDPFENADRALLNLGHTFGHAFEKCTGYNRLHGYAVAQGMVVACRLSVRLGTCDPQEETRLRAVLEKWHLPACWGQEGLEGEDAIDRVWEAMVLDKKRRDGELRLVLPERVGKVKLAGGVPEADIRKVLAELQ